VKNAGWQKRCKARLATFRHTSGRVGTGCGKEYEQGDDLEHAVADKSKKEKDGIQKLHGFLCYNEQVSVTAKMKGTDASIPLRPLSLSESSQSPQAAQTPKRSRLEDASAYQGMRYEVA